jgi:hypothetical protein
MLYSTLTGVMKARAMFIGGNEVMEEVFGRADCLLGSAGGTFRPVHVTLPSFRLCGESSKNRRTQEPHEPHTTVINF